MNIHFLYPSGNPTAIVCHKPNNPNQKYFIGGKIIEKYPSIEQVGFLYKENNNFTLEMTGNELCINASLSAFFLINKIYTKKVDIIYLKGPNRFIEGTFLDNGATRIWFNIHKNGISTWDTKIEQLYRVDFPWITHFYLTEFTDNFDNISRSLLDLFRYTLDVEAIWINQFNNSNGTIQLETYVMVKEAGTIIKETSCWSGCLWLTAIKLLEKNNEVNLDILQASWISIKTYGRIEDNDNFFLEIINTVQYVGKISYFDTQEQSEDLTMPHTYVRQVPL